jgi:hypothetical protein
MKKILAMAGLAAALSGCVVIVDPGNSPANPTTVSLTSSKYQNANGTEYYICGNQNNTLQVSFSYTGESQGLPRFGPYQFSTANGDTSTAVSRSITLTTNDIKPFKDRLTTQAVVVTPVPSDYGLGSFTAKVFLTGTDGTTNSLSSSQKVKVLTDKSSLCQ